MGSATMFLPLMSVQGSIRRQMFRGLPHADATTPEALKELLGSPSSYVEPDRTSCPRVRLRFFASLTRQTLAPQSSR